MDTVIKVTGLWACKECSTVCWFGVSGSASEVVDEDGYSDASADCDESYFEEVGLCPSCRRPRSFQALQITEGGKFGAIKRRKCSDCEASVLGDGVLKHWDQCSRVTGNIP